MALKKGEIPQGISIDTCLFTGEKCIFLASLDKALANVPAHGEDSLEVLPPEIREKRPIIEDGGVLFGPGVIEGHVKPPTKPWDYPEHLRTMAKPVENSRFSELTPEELEDEVYRGHA